MPRLTAVSLTSWAGSTSSMLLEPKCWSTGEDEDDPLTPETFRKKTVLSQHLSFLRDFFRAYKDFTDPQIDTIEILLSKLYSRFHISDYTNFSQLKPEDYPVLSDLYDLIEEEYKNYDEAAHNLYTHSSCRRCCSV